jgi:hypothetical protein
MSLNHDFLLLDRETDGEWVLTRFINDPRAIHLHDDLVRYMGDTLAWVPAYNPARQEPHRGLCMWGPTLIDATGAGVAEHVFRAWGELFAAGPPILTLTGNFSWAAEGERPPGAGRATQPEGGYDCLEFDRDEVVRTLRLLAHYAERVRSSGGRLYLLHQGV